MNGNELTIALIQGSDQINQMKKRTEQLVKILVGYIKLARKEKKTDFDKTFGKKGELQWRISVASEKSFFGGSSHVVCFEGEENDASFYRHDSFNLDRNWCKTKHAQRVFENLPVLVEGLAKELPELKDLWAPLIVVSNKAA